MPFHEFGDFVLDADRRRLVRRDGTDVVIAPRLVEALLYFIEHRSELLEKDTLLTVLWPGLVVEENSLSQTVSALRRALGDEAQASRYIQTVPRRGFRFVAAVTTREASPSPEVGSRSPAHRAIEPAPATPAAPVAPVAPPVATEAATEAAPAAPSAADGRRRSLLMGGAALALVAAGAGAWGWRRVQDGGSDRPTSLAILPFKPLVPEARDVVLEFGMADSLVSRLSTLPGVAVRSIGSVRGYAGPLQDPIQAARELDVTWIVDGSIQRWGDQVRVSARLLNAASGEAAWSGNFDEKFTGMFDLQDAISTRVAQVLAPHLGARGRRRLVEAGGTQDIDAYQLYVAARHQAQGIRTAGLVRSIALYRQAIALDPRFALAHVGVAESSRRMIFGADGEPRPIFEEAERNVRDAIGIAPDLADAYSSRGWNAFWWSWDWATAEETFRRAIALNPNEVNAHFGYGQLLLTLGRSPESLAQMSAARALDPQSLILLTLESNALFYGGRRDEGRAHLQRVFDLEPDFWVAHLTHGAHLLTEKRVDEAIASMEFADRHADGSSQAAAALGYVLAKTGRVDEARALLARFAEAAKTRYVPPTSPGVIHAGLGDREATIAALQRGHAVRDVRMTIVPYDGRWRLVHDDPRFREILRDMGLAIS